MNNPADFINELWRKTPEKSRPLLRWFWNDDRREMFLWLGCGNGLSTNLLFVTVSVEKMMQYGFISIQDFLGTLAKLRVAWKDQLLVSDPKINAGYIHISFKLVG